MTKHKLSKEELEEDILVTRFYQIQQYVKNNNTMFIGLGIAVVLLVGGIVGYNIYSSGQEDKAQNILANTQQLFINGNYEKALNGDSDTFTAGFKTIMNNYGGTKAGNLAHYYAAVSAQALGNTDEALTYIQDFDVPEGILGVPALQLRASLLEEQGNYAAAAEAYIEAAEWVKTSTTTPLNYISAARAYMEAQNMDQANTLIQKVLKDSEASQQLKVEARKLDGRLKTAA